MLFLYQRSSIMQAIPFASYQVAALGGVPAGPLKASGWAYEAMENETGIG